MGRIELPDKWRDENDYPQLADRGIQKVRGGYSFVSGLCRTEALMQDTLNALAWWLVIIMEQELRGTVEITARHMARRSDGRK